MTSSVSCCNSLQQTSTESDSAPLKTSSVCRAQTDRHTQTDRQTHANTDGEAHTRRRRHIHRRTHSTLIIFVHIYMAADTPVMCVAVCCSMLQCVAVCCSVLH